MRRNAQNAITTNEVRNLAMYHSGTFNRLTAYNSDRKIFLNSDYTVSTENTASILKMFKENSRMNLFGIELETYTSRYGRTYDDEMQGTIYCNVLHMIFDKCGFDDDFFKTETDCTVSAESVSQTFTKAWMRNNYRCFKAMYEMFDKLGITTNSVKVGMHVNMDLANFGSKYDEQIKNVRKFGYLINKHYDLFKAAFYRKNTEWCPRMNATKEYWKDTDLCRIPTAHNMCCVNVGHVRQNRVELRLVAGQKNYACFRNTMEVVFHIVDKIKSLSWDDLDDITKVFKGCNNYVYDRLNTLCFDACTISREQLDAIAPTVKTVDYSVR